MTDEVVLDSAKAVRSRVSLVAGAGFAVVADEVRNLAMRTSKAKTVIVVNANLYRRLRVNNLLSIYTWAEARPVGCRANPHPGLRVPPDTIHVRLSQGSL